MLRKEIKEYFDKQLEHNDHAMFSNSFPFSTINLDELEELFDYLAGKKIATISFSRRMKLTAIPESIGKIQTLTKLIITCRTVNYLPDSIGDLVNLRTLDIRRSNIKKIPSSINQLTNLTKLSLAQIEISTLPNISSLDKLENLILNDTNITNIPDYLCRLKKLNLIDVRNLKLEYFPKCLIDKGIKIKTNDVANLGLISTSGHSYQIYIQIKDELRTIIKQYLSYFNQYVKRSKQEVINFHLDEIENGLILNFKVQNQEDLEEIKSNLSEYVGFTEKQDNDIVPHITDNTSEYDKTMLMLELRQQLRNYHAMMENTKDNLKVIHASLGIPFNDLEYLSASTMIEGFKKISESTPVSNIYLEQTQTQSQQQTQTQQLKNDFSSLINTISELINNLESPIIKEEGAQLLEQIYPIATKPTEEKIEQSGLLPKLKNFADKAKTTVDYLDSTKETYNRFAENYNSIAKIFQYSLLTLLS